MAQVGIPHGEGRAQRFWARASGPLVGWASRKGAWTSEHLCQQWSCFSYNEVEKKSLFLLYLSVTCFNQIGRTLNFGITSKIFTECLLLLHARLYSMCWGHGVTSRTNPRKTKAPSSQGLHTTGDAPRLENMATFHRREPHFISEIAPKKASA